MAGSQNDVGIASGAGVCKEAKAFLPHEGNDRCGGATLEPGEALL